MGFLAATEVAINESPIGKIKCDGVMRINLMPGEHLLGFGREIKSEAAGRLRSINITIYPNKETIVEWKLTLSAFKILSITNR